MICKINNFSLAGAIQMNSRKAGLSF